MSRYALGDREYPSKKAAGEEFRRILNSAVLGRALRGSDAETVGLLLTAGRHPESVEKIGPGVAAVVVREAAYGTRCFWVQRIDGTEIDFSYLTALNGPPSPKAGAVAALRAEVSEQIDAFRLAADPYTVCGLCGADIGAVAEAHVDHEAPTFDELAGRFAAEVGGWEALAVECVGPYGRRLADRDLAMVWRLYHQQVARLRLVHVACNLQRRRVNA